MFTCILLEVANVSHVRSLNNLTICRSAVCLNSAPLREIWTAAKFNILAFKPFFSINRHFTTIASYKAMLYLGTA